MNVIYLTQYLWVKIWEWLSWMILARGLSWGCMRCWPGLHSSESLTGPGRSASNGGTHMAGEVCASYWWEASVSPHMELSIGLLECSQDMMAGCLQSEWSMRKQTGGCNASFSCLLALTHHHFLWFYQFPRSAMFHVRGNHTKMWKPEGEDPQAWFGVWAVLQSFLTQNVKIPTWSLLTLSSFQPFL